MNFDHNIAVTGASGYIGSLLSKQLKEKLFNVLGVSRNSAPNFKNFNLCCVDDWINLLIESATIVMLGDNTSVLLAEQDAVGVHMASSNVFYSLEAALLKIKLKKKPRIIFVSTATVYGQQEHLPVKESALPKPITNYDINKYFSELQLCKLSQLNLLDVVVFRLSNVYGTGIATERANERGVINKMCRLAYDGLDLTLYGSGYYLRDYIHIYDVVDAIIKSILRQEEGFNLYNLSSGRGVMLINAFEYIIQYAFSNFGSKSKIVFDNNVVLNPVDVRSYFADISMICRCLSWSPSITFEDGVKEIFTSYHNMRSGKYL